ncbi:type II toxin-antitoxin system RelB/DinJ family antitoxin [Treponema sp. OMZ 792]|uniref:type II toxin-antitoxin system RelB/DinJ family antitoxin n=1 Tax=unclassified Treponema TaxID=2638727 RepID=UPI0020A384F1|nr:MULTISPECIES: type II toxin-antitoxin system RelB/DinJ family antitoxin [unclassified Treponema]UTC76265.1 type II toxin-antitoxin system RelB/DinJ family antitoxin [Treponema sp. OMZ 792]UTC80265.1 type II toxin-antitoxin system RelB/DinJ family antitoxin [Treponema sp. OMZ 798]
MAQINVNIRMDADIKKEAEQLFDSLGMNMTTAFNIFIRQSLRIGGIPFKIMSDEKGFYNKYNQERLKTAAERMNQGKYIVHDTIGIE